MNSHFSEEELIELYYGERPMETAPHLEACPECMEQFEALRDTLDAVKASYPAPERGSGYGREVWARIEPKLDPRPKAWRRWWLFAPVFAGLLAIAFMAGRWTKPATTPLPVQPQQTASAISAAARERVLLISVSDHLERSQIVLAEILNAEPGTAEFGQQRERARELLGANRLLRQTAQRAGDTADAMVLEDLEHVLVEVANSPDAPSFRDAAFLQRRIRDKGLLFKVRVGSADSRERGMKL